MNNDSSKSFGDLSEETKREYLIKALKKSEQSGFIEDFDRDAFFNGMHRRLKEVGTADFKEGTTAFVEKRKANFTGQ